MQKLYNNLKVSTNLELQKVVDSFFGQFKVVAGEPYYTISPHKYFLTIPYYVPKKETNLLLTEHKLSSLALTLTLMQAGEYKRSEIRFIRLEYPYLDSCVLAKYLAYNANKYNFTQLQKAVLNNIPLLPGEDATLTNLNKNKTYYLPLSFITGVKLETAGRLITQRSVPRKTVDNTYSGTFNVTGHLGYSLSQSHHTSKNKLGAFTMKTWLTRKV